MPKKKEDHSLTKEEREILAEKLKPPSGMANWLNSSDIAEAAASLNETVPE